MDESFRKVLPYFQLRSEHLWLADVVMVIALLAVLGGVIWTVVKRRRWERHAHEGFRFAAQERGLSPGQIELLRRIAREGGMRHPLLILTSLNEFDRQLGGFLRREAEPKDRRVGESLAHIRTLLGFDELPTGNPMSTTRELKVGQRLMVWPEKGGSKGFCQCVVSHRDDEAIAAVPLLRLDDNCLTELQPDDRIKVRFWRDHDTEYRFRSRILKFYPHTTSIVIEHVEKLERVQKRDFFRLGVHFNIRFNAIDSGDEGTKHSADSAATPIEGSVHDLSGGGLSMTTESEIPSTHLLLVDSSLEVPFPLEDLVCRVIGQEELTRGKRVHLEFVDISRKAQGDLVHAIFQQQTHRVVG